MTDQPPWTFLIGAAVMLGAWAWGEHVEEKKRRDAQEGHNVEPRGFEVLPAAEDEEEATDSP